jgi:hypothetical protein
MQPSHRCVTPMDRAISSLIFLSSAPSAVADFASSEKACIGPGCSRRSSPM